MITYVRKSSQLGHLKAQGRDHGPWSIYYYLIDDLGIEHPPARSTIALWLHDAGVAEINARKRPRKSYKRWARDKVDELWQLDAHDAVQAWLDAGAAVEIVPVNYLGPRTTHKFSEHAASALALVAEKYPEHVLPAQAALFGMRPGTTTEKLADDAIAQALKDAGVPVAGGDDLDSRSAFVQDATDFSAKEQVTGVPELRVDGKAVDGETPEDLVAAAAAALGAE